MPRVPADTLPLARQRRDYSDGAGGAGLICGASRQCSTSHPPTLAPHSHPPTLAPHSQTPKRQAQGPRLDPPTLDPDPPSVEHHGQTPARHSLSLALDSSSFKFSTSESRVPASDSRAPRSEGRAPQFDPDAWLSEVENFEPKQRRSTVRGACVDLAQQNTSP
ncbi:hypothetical protein DL771_012478 [Monosporascus sp. 5C6A]|nr:hypothetical protein DL771_012478 [Monosporascus sp. 5C6A]